MSASVVQAVARAKARAQLLVPRSMRLGAAVVVGALCLSSCIVTEGPASIGTGSTDNPNNGIAVANGGTATGTTCVLPFGAGCLVGGVAANTTNSANGSWVGVTGLGGTGGASGAFL